MFNTYQSQCWCSFYIWILVQEVGTGEESFNICVLRATREYGRRLDSSRAVGITGWKEWFASLAMDIHYRWYPYNTDCSLWSVFILNLPLTTRLLKAPGWIFIPGLPSHRSAWYLTEEEKEHAIVRLGQPPKNTWNRTVFKRVLLSWQFWLLPTIFMRRLRQ
jgi:hypothetical protein